MTTNEQEIEEDETEREGIVPQPKRNTEKEEAELSLRATEGALSPQTIRLFGLDNKNQSAFF